MRSARDASIVVIGLAAAIFVGLVAAVVFVWLLMGVLALLGIS